MGGHVALNKLAILDGEKYNGASVSCKVPKSIALRQQHAAHFNPARPLTESATVSMPLIRSEVLKSLACSSTWVSMSRTNALLCNGAAHIGPPICASIPQNKNQHSPLLRSTRKSRKRRACKLLLPGTHMELAPALAAPVPLDLIRRTGGDVVRQVDVAVLLADAFLHASERLPVRRLARVAVVDEGGFPVRHP